MGHKSIENLAHLRRGSHINPEFNITAKTTKYKKGLSKLEVI